MRDDLLPALILSHLWRRQCDEQEGLSCALGQVCPPRRDALRCLLHLFLWGGKDEERMRRSEDFSKRSYLKRGLFWEEGERGLFFPHHIFFLCCNISQNRTLSPACCSASIGWIATTPCHSPSYCSAASSSTPSIWSFSCALLCRSMTCCGNGLLQRPHRSP